jgi:hypothetical protein
VDLSRKLRLLGVRVGKLAKVGAGETLQAGLSAPRAAEPEPVGYATTLDLF